MKMIHWKLPPTTNLRTLLSGNEINKKKTRNKANSTKYETYTYNRLRMKQNMLHHIANLYKQKCH